MNDWMNEWFDMNFGRRYDIPYPITSLHVNATTQVIACIALHEWLKSSPSQVKSILWIDSIQFKCTVQYSKVRELTWHDMHLQSIWMNMTWRHDMNMTTDDSTRFDSQTVLSQQHGTINKTIPTIQYNTATTMGMVFRTWYEYECYCSYYTHTHTAQLILLQHHQQQQTYNNNTMSLLTHHHYLWRLRCRCRCHHFFIKVSFLKLTFTLRYCFRLLVPEERKTKIESTTQQNKTKQTI